MAKRINAENDGAGKRIPIEQAVYVWRGAFSVEPRRDLLWWDLDAGLPDKKGLSIPPAELHQRIEDVALRAARRLWSLGYICVVLRSGRPGNIHLLAVGIPRALAEELTAEARATQCLDAVNLPGTARRPLRPPGSPHRIPGIVPQFLYPYSWAEALSALDRPVDQTPVDTIFLRPVSQGSPNEPLPNPRRGDKRGLSTPYEVLLRTGDQEEFIRSGGKPSIGKTRSDQLMAVTVAAVNAGWTYEDLEEAFGRSEHEGARRYQEMDAREARRWLVLTWNNAVRWVAAHPASGSRDTVLAQLDDFERAMLAAPWHEDRAKERVVLEELLALARRYTTRSVSRSLRLLGEDVGLTKDAVRDLLHKLEATGWIGRADKRPGRASPGRWTLQIPAPESSSSSPHPADQEAPFPRHVQPPDKNDLTPPSLPQSSADASRHDGDVEPARVVGARNSEHSPSCLPDAHGAASPSCLSDALQAEGWPSHALWGGKGLGNAALRVFQQVVRHPKIATRLVALLLKKDPSTALRQLHRLQGHGLVVAEPTGRRGEMEWTACSDVAVLDAAAEILGATAALESRRRRYVTERAAFKRALDEAETNAALAAIGPPDEEPWDDGVPPEIDRPIRFPSYRPTSGRRSR